MKQLSSHVTSLFCAGIKAKPRAPGPDHLWKYCKRCNTWKERPSDFSKNHRTPDGLQFYCRFCHNRMTKFNQQRRLEDQRIAEKQLHGIKSPKKHVPKPATARTSPFSDACCLSPASDSPSPPFDVIGSKVPRQQRTHATYRKDSDALPSAERSHTLSPAHSAPPKCNRNAPPATPAASTVGSDNGKSKQGSARKGTQRATSSASRPKPFARPGAQASAELMLQANAVLEELTVCRQQKRRPPLPRPAQLLFAHQALLLLLLCLHHQTLHQHPRSQSLPHPLLYPILSPLPVPSIRPV